MMRMKGERERVREIRANRVTLYIYIYIYIYTYIYTPIYKYLDIYNYLYRQMGVEVSKLKSYFYYYRTQNTFIELRIFN